MCANKVRIALVLDRIAAAFEEAAAPFEETAAAFEEAAAVSEISAARSAESDVAVCSVSVATSGKRSFEACCSSRALAHPSADRLKVNEGMASVSSQPWKQAAVECWFFGASNRSICFKSLDM